MGIAEEMQRLIEDMAALFGDVDDMDKMDAADFVDNADKIWALRERAREMVESQNGE